MCFRFKRLQSLFLCKVLENKKKKTEMSHGYNRLHFTQCLVEAPMAAITTSVLPVNDTTSVIHWDSGDFLPFSSADPFKLCQIGLRKTVGTI